MHPAFKAQKMGCSTVFYISPIELFQGSNMPKAIQNAPKFQSKIANVRKFIGMSIVLNLMLKNS